MFQADNLEFNYYNEEKEMLGSLNLNLYEVKVEKKEENGFELSFGSGSTKTFSFRLSDETEWVQFLQ